MRLENTKLARACSLSRLLRDALPSIRHSLVLNRRCSRFADRKSNSSRDLFLIVLVALIGLCTRSLAAETGSVTKVGFHYQPTGAFFGDPVPFYHDGVYHVFYSGRELTEEENRSALAWHHLASRDLMTWDVLWLSGANGTGRDS